MHNESIIITRIPNTTTKNGDHIHLCDYSPHKVFGFHEQWQSAAFMKQDRQSLHYTIITNLKKLVWRTDIHTHQKYTQSLCMWRKNPKSGCCAVFWHVTCLCVLRSFLISSNFFDKMYTHFRGQADQREPFEYTYMYIYIYIYMYLCCARVEFDNNYDAIFMLRARGIQL